VLRLWTVQTISKQAVLCVASYSFLEFMTEG